MPGPPALRPRHRDGGAHPRTSVSRAHRCLSPIFRIIPGNSRAAAGILFGLGLGGFFDGIVLHQVLQWHHMLTSAGYPPDSVENLEVNTFFDGLFHVATYVFVLLGLAVLWRTAHHAHLWWSWKLLVGTLLIGFGLFNLVEDVVDHHLLGIHHVNETVPREQWILLGPRLPRLGCLDGPWWPGALSLGDDRPTRS